MNRTLRVLNIEDSERDAALITRHLSRAGYLPISERVETPETMRAALEAREWDVILCDYELPHFNALSALALLNEMGLEIPFIIISGAIGEEVAVEAMRAGASDYLMKGNLARLLPTIEREIHEAENRRARRKAEAALNASDAELRAIFSAMTDHVILVIDAEGRHLKMAPTTSAAVYLPAAERVGKTLHEIFPQETADLFFAYVRRALDEGRSQRLEYSLIIDGRETWSEGTVSPMSPDSVVWIARDITERKRVEQALRESVQSKAESLALLDTIVSTAPIGFAFLNRDLVYERINETLAVMNGLPAAEHLGRALCEVIPEMAPVLEPIFRRVLETGEPSVNLEFSGETQADPGHQRFWLASSYPVRTQGGEVLGVGVLVLEITDRKHAEEALRESEERYRVLFASNPLPMWVYDLETLRFLEVNAAAVRRYEYSREEFLSMTIRDIRPPEDIPALLANVAEISSGLDEAGIWRHRKKNGEVIEVEITSHELTFAGRRAELVLPYDVTERRRSEEMRLRRASHIALRADVTAALAMSDTELPIILERCGEAMVQHLDATLAGIWALKKDENVLELQARAGIYPYIDGPNIHVPDGAFDIELIAKERRAYITNEVQTDPRVNDKAWAKQEGMIAFAGYPLIVEDRLVGVMAMLFRKRLADDTLDALASVADIISQGIERKRVEEALGASEEQLRQSQKLEAVGMLAGGIAHDFNNLLTAITGYSELTLRRLHEEDPLHRNISEVIKAAGRAAGLTRQLLAFSRKQVLQPKVLDLNELVSELEKLLQRLIGEDIGFRTVLESDLGSIKADPGQIEQIIMNLAVNARDAMLQGGKLTIETKNVYLDEVYAKNHIAVIPGPYVMLTVSDSGSGMDQQTQAHMFEPFFTTKEAGKGTGLGLSTVYGIVKQSGGNIWVYSEVGQGTTFKIYLPRVDEGAEEYRRNVESEEPAHGSGTILLAEDEELVRKLAREVLEVSGYTVLEAANGGAALLICERHSEPIQLLITDVIMPEMSGRELADRLAQIRPEMKVLYMSGYTDDAIVHQGVLDAGTNFIQKPFSTIDLARKVRAVLDSD